MTLHNVLTRVLYVHYIISSYELCISRRAILPFLEMLTVPFLLTSIKSCIHPEHFLSERVHQIFKCYDFCKHSIVEGFTPIFWHIFIFYFFLFVFPSLLLWLLLSKQLRNKSWKPEWVGSFNMDWRVHVFVFYPEPEARDKIY